jgi:hypothetical protein
MNKFSLLIVTLLLITKSLTAQITKVSIPLTGNENLVPVNTLISEENYLGKSSLKVVKTEENLDVSLVKVGEVNFKNGIIEVELAGKLAENAIEQARGFIGIAFRVNDDNSKFECIYLRPTNGRANEQIRRNHSVQYTSHPDFPWYRLRKEHPGEYESYVDLEVGAWTKIKIEVQGNQAKLYVHGNSQPTLIVNDLKLGNDIEGSIALWLAIGTEAYFTNLQVTKIN